MIPFRWMEISFYLKMESGQYLEPQNVIEEWDKLKSHHRREILTDYTKILTGIYNEHLYWKFYTLCEDKEYHMELKPEKDKTAIDKATLETLDKIVLTLVKAVNENLKNKPC